MYLYKVLLPLYYEANETKIEIVLAMTQMVFLAVSLQNIYVQSKRFEMGTPVSRVYQAIAWIIAGITLVSILYSKKSLFYMLSSQVFVPRQSCFCIKLL